MTVVDVRNPSLAAEGPETWCLPTVTMMAAGVRNSSLVVEDPVGHLPTFIMTVANVRNPGLATEAAVTWRLLIFVVTVADDIEIQAWPLKVLRHVAR